MIVRTQKIRFTADRTPMPKKIVLGFESDNMVERLEFELPEVSEGQTATLMTGGAYADAVRLEPEGNGKWSVDLTADMVGPADVIEGYIRIDGTDGAVWNSGVMRLATKELPDVDQEIEQRFPTAVEQMLGAMAEHDEAMEDAVKRAEDAAAHADKVKDGGYYLPEVTEAGVLSWTGSKENMPGVPSVNVKGPRGETGPAGPQGEKGEKGETGPKGADGTMSFEDLTDEQRESLRGERGPQGPQGIQGLQGVQGPQGETGPQGAQGLKGDTGPQGPAGPKGDAGDTGPTGPEGPPGAEGPMGPTGESGVYVGSEEPTDENIKVWIKPDGDDGGDGFEMIETITIEEDGLVAINADLPHAYKRLMIRIVLPRNEDGSTTVHPPTTWELSGEGQTARLYYSGLNMTYGANGLIVLHVDIENGLVRYKGVSGRMADSIVFYENTHGKYYETEIGRKYSAFTRIYASANSGVFAKGTTVEVEGVRANA